MTDDEQTHPVINVEETIGKTVGRRKPISVGEQARRIQDKGKRIYRASGFRVCTKGVYRFHSHEEADEWMRQMAVQRAIVAEKS